jgi:hypothetical protein
MRVLFKNGDWGQSYFECGVDYVSLHLSSLGGFERAKQIEKPVIENLLFVILAAGHYLRRQKSRDNRRREFIFGRSLTTLSSSG